MYIWDHQLSSSSLPCLREKLQTSLHVEVEILVGIMVLGWRALSNAWKIQTHSSSLLATAGSSIRCTISTYSHLLPYQLKLFYNRKLHTPCEYCGLRCAYSLQSSYLFVWLDDKTLWFRSYCYLSVFKNTYFNLHHGACSEDTKF